MMDYINIIYSVCSENLCFYFETLKLAKKYLRDNSSGSTNLRIEEVVVITEEPNKKEIKRKLDMDLLVSLLKGNKIVLCGNKDQPSVVLELYKGDVKKDLEETLDEIEIGWDQ